MPLDVYLLQGNEKIGSMGSLSNGQGRENLTFLHANNKGRDQPVHPLSFISASVVHLY